MKSNKGFTAVELIISLFVIGIFCTVMLTFFGNGLGYAYGIIFSKEINGKVIAIQNIQPNMIATDRSNTAQLFSSVIAIQTQDGQTVTASAEDRQWYLVKEGQCVVAKFYPYAPWFFSKAGTYHGARLEKITPCG